MSSSTAFLSLRGRANAAVALLVASALVSVLSIVYELDVQSLVGPVAAGDPAALAQAQAADENVALVSVLGLAALIATGATFIAWFHRAYVNIERLGARGLRSTKGWSIGAWFVPILNLVRPKQLMDDIWRASDPALPAGELRGWRTAAVPGLLHLWWAMFLVMGFIGNIAGRQIAGAETLAERDRAGEIGIVTDAGTIVTAVLAVLVVRAVTARQESRAARVGGAGPPLAPAAAAPAAPAARPNSVPPPMTSG